MSDSLSTLADAAKAATAKLLADLKEAGATDLAAAQAFAEEYGPIASLFAIKLAQAKVAGDKYEAKRFTDDLADVAALAAAKIATMGITAESIAETDVQEFVTNVLKAAGKAALVALV